MASVALLLALFAQDGSTVRTILERQCAECHGRYLAFDQNQPPPLCNLFVSMLQQLGVPVDKFGSSTGTLTGLSAK